jgi:hypothetical protein
MHRRARRSAADAFRTVRTFPRRFGRAATGVAGSAAGPGPRFPPPSPKRFAVVFSPVPSLDQTLPANDALPGRHRDRNPRLPCRSGKGDLPEVSGSLASAGRIALAPCFLLRAIVAKTSVKAIGGPGGRIRPGGASFSPARHPRPRPPAAATPSCRALGRRAASADPGARRIPEARCPAGCTVTSRTGRARRGNVAMGIST